MSKVITVKDYVSNPSRISVDDEVSLRINLDSLESRSDYEHYFLSIVQKNPAHITKLIVYGQFDDHDSYGYADLITTIFQNCAKLTFVRTLEINSVKLDYHLSSLLCKVVGTMEQRMLLNTLRIINCQLGSQQTLTLVGHLKANTNIHVLDISGNYCGDSIFPLLLENMTKFEQGINAMSFSHNNISDTGTLHIRQHLFNPHLIVILFAILCFQDYKI